MNGDRKLMLIDGHALVHRAYHAVPPLTTSSGEITNAVFGFANILLKEIGELHPTHVIMAMDRPTPTFRHRAYAAYKATRARTPEPLVSQFQRVRQLAGVLKIPIFEVDGFEADDVLGTLAMQAEREGISTVIVTGDLDALQLVSDHVRVLTPGRGISETTLYDLERVASRYGLQPSQLPDWKALVGDTSDNIPGVPGIGAKSASSLLAKYGSLEGIVEHLDDLPAKQRELLSSNLQQAFDSRELARIVRDVPVELQLGADSFADLDDRAIVDLLRELEFRSLIDRVRSLMPAAPSRQDTLPTPVGTRQLSMFGEIIAESVEVQAPRAASTIRTRTVTTLADLDLLIQVLQAADAFACDTETTSTDPLRARLVGLSFATRVDQAWYVPVGHERGDQLALPEVVEALRPVLTDADRYIVGHNLKYDYTVLKQCGLAIGKLSFDTMIAAYLVNPNSRGLSLDALALARFGLEMTPIESLIGKGKSQITMDMVDIDTAAAYAGEDAAVTLRLKEVLASELEDRELTDLFHNVEMPLVSVLADMEEAGVCLDISVLEEMSREMTETLGRLEGEIYEQAGHRFNINSTAQLGQVLFAELQLPSGRRTKTGYSTDSEVLENLRGAHPIVERILEYRQLIKLKNTYIDALPSLINPRTGRVHTDFNQCVAATGRLSSSNPNLQNIPIRSDVGRKIRRAFVPTSQENVLLAADYSQIELRILASMSGDERLVQAFTSGEDIHRATASAVFGVPLAEVTADQRRIAKVVNFGIIYGIGEQRLAHETGITRQEAAEFISSYNRTYSGVKAFMDELRKQAILRGYVATLLNRRRYLPDIHSNHPGIRTAAERAAINMPIQGTAADIIKLAMINLHLRLPDASPGAKMVLQVHDELVFDVPGADVESVAELVRHTMESAIELNVPLEVEAKVGRDWYDMKEMTG